MAFVITTVMGCSVSCYLTCLFIEHLLCAWRVAGADYKVDFINCCDVSYGPSRETTTSSFLPLPTPPLPPPHPLSWPPPWERKPKPAQMAGACTPIASRPVQETLSTWPHVSPGPQFMSQDSPHQHREYCPEGNCHPLPGPQHLMGFSWRGERFHLLRTRVWGLVTLPSISATTNSFFTVIKMSL